MIAGVVNHALEATVDMTIRGPAGHEERLEFVVDTGFSGNVSIHPAVAAALELPDLGVELGRLSDGSDVWSGLSEAQLLWNGVPRTVSVNSADNVSMLGMQLLEGHALFIHVVPRGEVRIEAVPDPKPKPG